MIHLYRRPLLDEWVETGVSLEELITHVIVHEVGHHFGFSDADMHAIEDAGAGERPAARSTTSPAVRGGRLLFEGLSLALGAGRGGAGHRAQRHRQVEPAPDRRRPAARRRPGASSAPAAALADEHLALDERQTLGEALGFWARLDGGDADAGMEAMGLAHLAEVPVRMLSTGQRKRAALARVIASGAPLWLLDEPANGLDADGRRRLAAAMAAHRAARRRGARRLAPAARPRRRADGGARHDRA